MWLVFQLLDVVYREETLLNVIRSVTRNGRSIILTAVLALILVYMFSIIGYMFFKDDFLVDIDEEVVRKYTINKPSSPIMNFFKMCAFNYLRVIFRVTSSEEATDWFQPPNDQPFIFPFNRFFVHLSETPNENHPIDACSTDWLVSIIAYHWLKYLEFTKRPFY